MGYNLLLMTGTFLGTAFDTKNHTTPVAVGDSLKLSSRLVGQAMEEINLSDYEGQKLVINVFTSIDTEVCAAGVRKFNLEASKFENTKVLCISADLPFAFKRFCGAEGIENVHTFSMFRSTFAEKLGLEIGTGVLKHLCRRAVIVTDVSHKAVFVDIPAEVTEQVKIEEALAAIESLA